MAITSKGTITKVAAGTGLVAAFTAVAWYTAPDIVESLVPHFVRVAAVVVGCGVGAVGAAKFSSSIVMRSAGTKNGQGILSKAIVHFIAPAIGGVAGASGAIVLIDSSKGSNIRDVAPAPPMDESSILVPIDP